MPAESEWSFIRSRYFLESLESMMSLRFLMVGFVLWPVGLSLMAQDQAENAEYRKVARARAEKIIEKVEGLEIAQRPEVTEWITEFYCQLHDIQSNTESEKATKRDSPSQGANALDTDRAQRQLHFSFVSKLETSLSHLQVESIKDGITYHVMPRTLQAYKELYPLLNDEQTKKIHAWLWEAREWAIDAGSSDAKHAMFGKYKGRINNYLSQQGLNAKEAERALKERQTQASKK